MTSMDHLIDQNAFGSLRSTEKSENHREKITGNNLREIKKKGIFNPHAPYRFTPSRVRFAKNCGSALTHP